MTNKRADRIIVIGGGVIGAMCAWYLSKSGCKVTILEQHKFGSGCSHGNCGYVSPSHILPLAQPGAVARTIKAMLGRNSALKIKLRPSLSMWSWFWNFSRQCNREAMMSAAIGRHEMLQSSRALYDELVAGESIDCEWQSKGLLFVFDTDEEQDSYRQTHDLIRDNFGVSATPYDRDQVIEMEPTLKPVFAGAWHYEGDSHIRPDLLMSAMKDKLTDVGVEMIENCKVEKILKEQGRAVGVSTSQGELEADQYLIATGAWAPFLNRELGCKIPIQPGKGYSVTMPTPEKMPKYPMIFETTHVAITPMKSKYRIGSTMEFAGYDSSINPKRIQLLKDAAAKYLVEPYCDPIEEEWYGWRPMTWDGKPIIDRSPALENVWIAAGHNMLGLSMATGTGRLVKELVLGESPHIDPDHFAISRF